MKINFKFIVTYTVISILLPLMISLYLSNKSKSYFLNYKVLGLKDQYKNQLGLYLKVGRYMNYANEATVPSELVINNLIENYIQNYDGFTSTITKSKNSFNTSFNIVLRGDKDLLENLDFEDYTYQIEEGVRNYFINERINLTQVIKKLENLKLATARDYTRRLENYQSEEVTTRLENEMANLMTTLESRILVPKLRLSIIEDINEENKESIYFYNYKKLKGVDKKLSISFDHFLKFFILANIFLFLLNISIIKRIYIFLSADR